MFKKKKEKIEVYIDGSGVILVDPDIADGVRELQRKFDAMKRENLELREELNAVKPVVQNKQLKPAVSTQCKDCLYVCKSSWSGNIIGCKKDCVCKDYCPEKNEE